MNPTAFRFRSLLAAAVVTGCWGCFTPPRADATTYTWGTTASGNWTKAANWAGNVAPPTGDTANTDIVFGASSSSASVVDTGYSIHSLTFNAANNGYNISSPYSLTIGTGGLTQLSAQTQVLAAVYLSADQTWNLGSNPYTAVGLLNFSSGGIITNNHALTINVPASATLNGGTIQGSNGVSAGLIKTGAGTLTLAGPSLYTGVTHIDAGTLVVGDQVSLASVLMGTASTLTFTGTGGLFNSTDTALYVESFTPNGPAVVNLYGTGSVVSNGGGVGISGGSGVLNQTGGTLSAGTNGFNIGDGNGVYNLLGGAFVGTSTYGNTTVIGYSGTGTVNQSGGTFTVPTLRLAYTSSSSGTYNLNGGTLSIGGGESGQGNSTLNFNGGILQPTGDNYNFLSGFRVANVRRGGLVIDTAGRTVVIGQDLQHSAISGDAATDGGLVKTGAGTLTLSGSNSYNGGTTILAGKLIVADDSSLGSSRGAVTITGGSLAYTNANVSTSRSFYLSNNPISPASGGKIGYYASTINGGILGAGTHNLGNSTVLNGTRTTVGTVLIQNGGPVTLQNVTFGGDTTFTQTSQFTVNATGDFVTLPQTTTNVSGVFSLNGGYVAGALNIAANAQVNESNATGATTPLYLDGSRGTTVNSGGQLSAASGSSIELGGLLTNNGTQTGTLNVNLGGFVAGYGKFGTVNLAGGSTFNAAGTINGSLMVAKGATVDLSGVGNDLLVSGALTNNGTMRFERGATLTVSSGSGNFVNNGTIDVITGGFSAPAGFTNNGVVIDSSVVRVKEVTRNAANGAVSVSIDGYPGHTYQLQKSDSLDGASFANVPGVPAQSRPASNTGVTTLAFTDSNAAPGQGFYRVQVDP